MTIFFIIVLGFTLNKKDLEGRALFSWSSYEVTEGRTELFQTMEKLKLNALYQHFSTELQQEDIEQFLLDAADKEIKISLLTGDASWALDKEAENMIHTIERVVQINSNLDERERIKSIVFDVEPYLLEEWDEETSEEIMDNFVRGAKIAYNKANENELEVIVCIPYYYDKIGHSKQLEELIRLGSDSIAVMNYYKNKEANHIKEEVALADKYGKTVINIYELQAPGQYGLEDENTYYNDGVAAIEKNFTNIKEEYYGKDIIIAFHEYNALKEVLERE